MAGSLTLQGVLTGTTAGTQYIGPYTITPNAAGNFAVTETTLASGANTITVPTWATSCVIVPPVANAVALTLKGVTGDTGIAMSLTQASELAFPATPPASFVITAASLTANPTTFIFS